MADPPVVVNQSFTPFPKLLTRFVDPQSGNLEVPWHRFLIALWRKTGGSNVPVSGSVVLTEDTTGEILAYGEDGSLLGIVQLEAQHGGVPQIVAPLGSPRVYSATSQGTLLVQPAKVELSRDSGTTWFLATLLGGAFPLKVGDSARVSWVGANSPVLTFFPDGVT